MKKWLHIKWMTQVFFLFMKIRESTEEKKGKSSVATQIIFSSRAAETECKLCCNS